MNSDWLIYELFGVILRWNKYRYGDAQCVEAFLYCYNSKHLYFIIIFMSDKLLSSFFLRN